MAKLPRVQRFCETCFEPFFVPAWYARQGLGHWCSPGCRTVPRPFTALEREAVFRMHGAGAQLKDIAAYLRRSIGGIAPMIAEGVRRGELVGRYADSWERKRRWAA